MLSNNRMLLWLLPFLIFVIIAYFSWLGLHNDVRLLPSPLINHSMPTFQAQSLLKPKELISEKNFLGKVTVLNVFATWCIACHAEHTVWLEAREDLPNVQLFGLNYKDQNAKTQKWLKQYGNPYEKILVDTAGSIGINLGVYGTPETFIIDRHGIIRYKYVGAVSPTVWKTILLPEVKKWHTFS